MVDDMRDSIGEHRSMGGNENLLYLPRNGKIVPNTGMKKMGWNRKKAVLGTSGKSIVRF
jgi:hypothetical protein